MDSQIARNLAKKIVLANPDDAVAQATAVVLTASAELATDPVAALLVDDDELVYVARITDPDPVAHMYGARRDGWDYTACGTQISYTFKNTVMPWQHAVHFAQPCQGCFHPEETRP